MSDDLIYEIEVLKTRQGFLEFLFDKIGPIEYDHKDLSMLVTDSPNNIPYSTLCQFREYLKEYVLQDNVIEGINASYEIHNPHVYYFFPIGQSRRLFTIRISFSNKNDLNFLKLKKPSLNLRQYNGN